MYFRAVPNFLYKFNNSQKIVKDIFNDLTVTCVCDPRIPICNCDTTQNFKFGKNKKLFPSDDEINKNSRSASATLRYVVKI